MAVNNVKSAGTPTVSQQSPLPAPEGAKTERTAARNAARAYEKSGNNPTIKDAANVQISPRAKEMSLARKIAEETPDVREDKVQKLKAQIASGEYKLDPGKIADGVLHEAMRDEIAKDPDSILH